MSWLRDHSMYTFRVVYDMDTWSDGEFGNRVKTEHRTDMEVKIIASSEEVAQAYLDAKYRTSYNRNVGITISPVREKCPVILWELPQ